jgi:hypothetical protein
MTLVRMQLFRGRGVVGFVFPLVAMSAACGGSNGANASNADGGSSIGPAMFQPAIAPESACALLTAADVATLLPNAQPGRAGRDINSQDAFIRNCSWESPGSYTSNQLLPTVSLAVEGATTPDGQNSVIVPPAIDRGGTREELSGVGDEAAYFDSEVLGTIGVVANYGNYVVELDADDFPMPPSKDAIVALVKKVIGELH